VAESATALKMKVSFATGKEARRHRKEKPRAVVRVLVRQNASLFIQSSQFVYSVSGVARIAHCQFYNETFNVLNAFTQIDIQT